MGRRPRPKQERLSLRRYLLSNVHYTSRRGGPGAHANIAVRPLRRDSRRVLVKAHFVRMTAQGGGAQAAHLRYIQRDGIDAEASPSVLYGPEGPVLPETAHEVRPGERRQFRIIVSPEDSRDLDLTDFVQRLMAQAGRDLGRDLEWVAINHYNTQQPHTHVVVRGIDRQGWEVRFEPAYISNGLRWRAQEIATKELGPRPEFELRRALEREVSQERFTSLDRDLERRADDHRLELRRPSSHRASMLLARAAPGVHGAG